MSSLPTNNNRYASVLRSTISRGRPSSSQECSYCNQTFRSYRAQVNHSRSCPARRLRTGQEIQYHGGNENIEVAEDDMSMEAIPDYTDDASPMNQAVESYDLANGKCFYQSVFMRWLYFNTINDLTYIEVFADEEEEFSGMPPSVDGELLNVKYKTTGVVEEGDEDRACVYDYRFIEDASGPNQYTTSQLLSIELYEIVKESNIPRDAYRKLVRLMNTTIRDTEKLQRGMLTCKKIEDREAYANNVRSIIL